MNMSTMRCCSTWNVPSVVTELLARLAVFKRRRVQFGHRADRFGAERGDGAVAAGFERRDALAFRSQQLARWDLHVHQCDLGGAPAVDRLEALQMKIGANGDPRRTG